jgi:hypothetical protein
MKVLKYCYQTLSEQYPALIAEIEKNQYMYVYSTEDFFSLKPFEYELVNKRKADIKFFESDEEVQGDALFLCAVEDRKIHYCREYFAQGIYNDNFFTYDDNISQRLCCYVNKGKVEAKSAEILIKSPNGAPLQFKRFGSFGNELTQYTVSTEKLDAESKFYDTHLQEISSSQLLLETYGMNELQHAYHVNTQGEKSLIFDSSMGSTI